MQGEAHPSEARSAAAAPAARTPPWHALDPVTVAELLGVTLAGICDAEATERLRRYGPNRLRAAAPPSRMEIFLRQFKSPLIYVLLAASLVALALRELADAGFIAAVLLLNAAIGFANEFRAERAVQALFRLVRTRARVRRDGRLLDIDGEDVVPGDLLLVESGARISADLRLVETRALRVDESLLTGESLPVDKDAGLALAEGAPLADQRTLLFAGTVVVSGRGFGLVVATGAGTQVGAIAGALARISGEPPPLLRRMERFARVIGATTLGLAALLVALGVARGQPFGELLLGAVALAVSAVPEGLPVALTVALALAVSRMAERRVVVRQLPAVEALGSCGVIATDKTGTLTCNELTVERVAAGELLCEVTGKGYVPEGALLRAGRTVVTAEHPRLFRVLRTACLANEGSLTRHRDGEERWEWSGDPTDVALLALGVKAGVDPVALRAAHPTFASLPFEPERRYAASQHERDGGTLVCVKGAPERVLAMCTREREEAGGPDRPLDRPAALAQVEALMREGYRVLAVAEAETAAAPRPGVAPAEPAGLEFLGLVAMTDPPRSGVEGAIAACQRAGVDVVMVTGDHATTASAIATRIGLAGPSPAVLTGGEIAALDDAALAARMPGYRLIARATPADKLRIVRAWQSRGSIVAVTGDGVNDAPALRQADLGIAMGRSGSDVAREAADLVLTDDDFSSIVAGIEEGRVAYDNIRKVTYLLVSTGAGEVLLVSAAIALGHPIPLAAAQLLWLNLVTNGIQDVALAFEAGEPGALTRPPRPARERIFNRLMVQRTLLAALVFGGLGLGFWLSWLAQGRPVEEARNLMVQLFVLFEVFHIGNARSERISLFRLSPLRNPFLLVGTLGALGVHVAALYAPWTQRLLGLAPIPPADWLILVLAASSIVLVMEAQKAWLNRRDRRRALVRPPART